MFFLRGFEFSARIQENAARFVEPFQVTCKMETVLAPVPVPGIWHSKGPWKFRFFCCFDSQRSIAPAKAKGELTDVFADHLRQI
jgi:hypothetical protein